MKPNVAFFYNHAGYSYKHPETPAEGRLRCAQALADAETAAKQAGVFYHWGPDDCEPGLWDCRMYSPDGDSILASLGAVDFGPEGEPNTGEPYQRVVEAELALQEIGIIEAWAEAQEPVSGHVIPRP